MAACLTGCGLRAIPDQGAAPGEPGQRRTRIRPAQPSSRNRADLPRSIVRLGAALLLLLSPAAGQAQPTEQSMMAAFIPKFARYVRWPPQVHVDPREPIQLCVIGHDPFGALLDRAAARERVGGRPVVVRRLADAAGFESCHLAFVRGVDDLATRQLLEAMGSQPVLTITDSRAGTARGMIHFTIAGGRLRFFIDQAEAEARGLVISSRLLALALGVRQRRS